MSVLFITAPMNAPTIYYAHTFALPSNVEPNQTTSDDFLAKINSKRIALYELISNQDTPIRFYTDSDFIISRADFSNKMCRIVEQKLKKYLQLALREVAGIDADFAMATSHTDCYDAATAKISVRFYAKNITTTMKTIKAFIETLNKYIDSRFDTDDNIWEYVDRPANGAFDLSVYSNRRFMRCIWTSKPGESRQLILIDGFAEDTIIQSPPADSIPFVWVAPSAPVSVSSFGESADDDINTVRELSNIMNIAYIDDYHNWMRLVWAIRSIGDSADWRKLAVDMSKRSNKYSDAGFDIIWDNYRAEKTGKGYFYAKAKASNAKMFAKIISKPLLPPGVICDSLLNTLEISEEDDDTSYVAVKKRWELRAAKIREIGAVLVISGDGRNNYYKERDLLFAYPTKCDIEETSVDKKGNKITDTKSKSFIKIWLQDTSARVYDRLGFYPRDVGCPTNEYNTWTPYTMELITQYTPKPEIVGLFYNHVFHLCGKNKLAADYVMLYIAHLIQAPYEKPGIMIVMTSKQGAGKGAFIDCLTSMIGESKTIVTSNPQRDVTGPFNSLMEGRILLNLNECDKRNFRDSDGPMKAIVTDKTMIINNKGLKSYTINSFLHVILTANPDDAFVTSSDDRRNFFVEASNELIGKTDYFTNFYKMITDKDALKTLYEHFAAMPNGKNFCKMPMPETEKQRDLKVIYESPLRLWLRDFAMSYATEKCVRKTAATLFESFNLWREQTKTISGDMSLIKFGFALKNLHLQSLSETYRSAVGNMRDIDIPKLRKELGCEGGAVPEMQ